MSTTPAHYAEGPEPLIVRLAIAGDRDAFEELVNRRQSWIRNLMRRLCNDSTLADDLSQQVFMQAWRKIRQLKDPSRFAGWLKQLAVNEWLQYVRRNDPLRGALEESDMAQSTKDQTSVGMDLDRALAALPLPVRTCIVLSYHERMTHEEIEAATGIKLGTVKSHIRRGSERLRESLGAYVQDQTAGTNE